MPSFRDSIPIFNLDRGEICCSMGLTVSLCLVVVSLVVWQPDVGMGFHRANVVIFFSVLLSLVCIFISAVKLICGFGNVCAGEDDDYEELKDAIPTSIVVDAPSASGSPSALFGSPTQLFRKASVDPPPIQPFRAASAEQQQNTVQNLVSLGPPAVQNLVSIGPPAVQNLVSVQQQPAHSEPAATAPSGTGGAANRVASSTQAPQTVSSASRAKDVLVEAGIVLEQVGEGAGPRGSWRVKAVAARSPCARQGACDEGDVVVAVNGQPLGEAAGGDIEAMLRGKIGATITLELDGGQRRTVILAPDPAALADLLR
ncbi:hypothetical protein T484DRAFT_1981763 [Baffinella frigidus]|nr:hypothetical protein T484DRAFT_1981763 [Cryptophyta sp. CCMP2293]|mmetsp:Transcript_15467/g.35966  ORF Transcript_15467/g.35966 Transcript_15467/m.35966 type:complete len:314 (-) Transcript_15467:245-1186(-)